MTVLELSAMTWEEVRDLDRAKAVAILPTGALEAHGPHLPLSTDVIIAEAMARRCADKLSARGYDALLLPALGYTATVTALIVDVASSLGRHGFPVLAIANAHLDPAHVASINAALAARGGDHLPRMVFPDVAKKPWAVRLTEEFRSGTCHAGRYESSVVLAARPDLVREGIRQALPANPRS